MSLLHALRFASDATLLAVLGAVFLLLAALAWLGQVRRMRRTAIDAVGWVPWSGLSLLLFGIGALALLLAALGLLKG
ncbi:MAG: hypothetical protein ABIT10_04870 [Alteraurantiacibacter sp.]